MKKLLIAFFIGIFLTSLVIGVTSVVREFNDRQEAEQYFETYKAQREADVTQAANKYRKTSDKYCWINYDLEIVICNICWEINYSGTTDSGCFALDPDTSEQEDTLDLETHIRERYDLIIPKERIEYDEYLTDKSWVGLDTTTTTTTKPTPSTLPGGL